MKKTLTFLCLLLSLATNSLQAQTTITANGYVPPTTSIYPYTALAFSLPLPAPPAAITPMAVTFTITTTYCPVTLQSVAYAAYTNSRHRLWYSITNVTGIPGNVAAPTWTLLATNNTATPLVTTTTLPPLNNSFTGLNLTIPANTTYRFAFEGDEYVVIGRTYLTPGTYTSGGVTLNVSSTVSYVGATNAVNNNTSFGGFYGSITFDPPSCPLPMGGAASNIFATQADLSWNPVSGSAGYDYIVDQNPTYNTGTLTNTSSTSFTQTGLLPNTNYYLHVRNRCSATDFSCMSDIPFKTLPPCSAPEKIKVTAMTTSTANFVWDGTLGALSYDYVVDQVYNAPAVTGTNTLLTGGNASSLSPDTKYYVHIRTNCGLSAQSGWMVDSFTTLIACNPPAVKISDVNTHEAVVYWDAIPGARKYEYAINKSATPPAHGTEYAYTSLHTPVLNDGAAYYIHVRTLCNEQPENNSAWATSEFKTIGLGINDMNSKELTLNIYPNPAKDKLHISIGGAVTKDATINITDLSGRTVQQIDVQGAELDADIKALAPGIYILKYTGGNYEHVKRLIKN